MNLQNNHMQKLLMASFLCFVVGLGLHRHNQKDETKYREESVEMRKTVWAWEKPQFKVTATPAEYAKASKIVLAHHTELTADSKSKFAFYGLGFGLKKNKH
jgi:hypothetical protein